MPQPKSDAALADARSLMDQAMESENGIRVRCNTKGQAISLRFRLYAARTRFREAQRKAGKTPTSPWDALTFMAEPANPDDPEGEWNLFITLEPSPYKVEKL